jgi:tRNA threonylcarbamoyladenosine biosynthesis protein TsaE
MFAVKHCTSHKPTETEAFASVLARQLVGPTQPRESAAIVALTGGLGSGKTTFVRGLARALGVRRRIVSPTFLIVRSYRIPRRLKPFELLFHIDCYRIHRPAELAHTGFESFIANPTNIVIIEWAERIIRALPSDIVWVTFDYGAGENERIIKIGKHNRTMRTKKS